MRSTIFALMLGAAASVTACDKGPDGAASIPSATAALASAAPVVSPGADPAASAAQGAPTVENIPVAADFEEEAEKSITKANYRTELDSIEAELK